MNIRRVIYNLGKIVLMESALLLLPFITALIYGEENTAVAFIAAAVAAGVIGGLLVLLNVKSEERIYAREGFVITASAWIVMSLIGALPFVISGDIESYTDAFFETVSGFTTTGASILTDVEAMSHGCLFWRSFTHWIGGMGVLVLMMAIMPDRSGRTIHIMRAEMPGPVVERIVPKVRGTAKILYYMYIVLTAVQVILMLLGGMPLFDSLCHAFGTAGTGGFGIKGDSIGGYTPYLQWVITAFMLIFGINFNVYFLITAKKWRQALKSEEMWVYLGIVAASSALIAQNIMPQIGDIGEAVRHAAFQVASIITTTGYSTVDFDLWPLFSKSLILLLMCIGACAGSTGGGLKVSRLIILLKSIGSELRKMIHPRSVATVRFEGKKLEEHTRSGVGTYFALYALCIVIVFLCISVEPFDIETNLSAAVSCFNNIGPGFGSVGPLSSFAGYSDVATVFLSFAMLFGRLEIYPMLILLSPGTWTRK